MTSFLRLPDDEAGAPRLPGPAAAPGGCLRCASPAEISGSIIPQLYGAAPPRCQ